MKKLSLGAKQMSGFIAVALIMVLVGVTGFLGIETMKGNTEDIVKSAPLIDAAMEMKMALAQDMQIVMELLGSESIEELNEFWEWHEQNIETFDIFADAIINGAETDEGTIYAAEDESLKDIVREADKQHNDEFRPDLKGIYDAKKEILNIISRANSENRNELQEKISKIENTFYQLDEEADEVGTKTMEILGEIEDMARDQINAATEKADASARFTSTLMLITVIIGFVVAMALGFFISQSITRPVLKVIDALSGGSAQVQSASGQLSSSSQQLAQGASEQASSLEEISSSIEELTSMTKQNADNSMQANNMGKDASSAGDIGLQSVNKMSETVNGIKKSSDETAQIIKTIDEIAMQTNLLALNAAVEAARAGDAGRGFAVVAEEVRSLAQRSADAAKNTAVLIEGMQKNSESGVQASVDVENSIKEITETINKMTGLLGEVSSASNEQAQGLEQINKAVSEMDKVTQQNAANSEESASASEELAAQAQSFDVSVNNLKGIIGGTNNASKYSQISYSPSTNSQEYRGAKHPYRREHDIDTPHELSVLDHKKHEVTPEELIPFKDEKGLQDF